MTDELDTRVRSLDAERQRPERALTPTDLFQELIGTLHSLFTTPPDNGATHGIEARLEEYHHLREQGLTKQQAAEAIGISAETARRYDHHLRAQGAA